LNGSEDKAGLIKQFEDDLLKPITSKSNLTAVGLQAMKESIETDIGVLTAKQDELSKASQQVSFKQLYEAVTQLKESSPERCPACHTSLSQVRVNPFEHADAELIKLQHLVELQEALKKVEGDISTSLTKLLNIVNICCSRFPENNPLSALQVVDENAAMLDLWNSIHQQLSDKSTPWQYLEIQTKQLEETDKEIDQATAERTGKKAKLTQLREFSEKIIKLQTRRETANKAMKKAEEAIEKFDAENVQLIKDVEDEETVVTQNQAIADAYAIFVQKMNAYKNGLPAQLVTDLGETVVQLYNAFNRNDVEQEKLSGLRLPLQQNQRLEISFKNDPETYFDALHVLSEGHIRCIGLAILTAKNIKENCPLLIFDDPVNAIDDDHRESIRQTFFEDAFFNDKQIILACHGEEFLRIFKTCCRQKERAFLRLFPFYPKLVMPIYA